MPGVLNVTLPGFWAVEVAGVPPGKTHEKATPLVLALKLTVQPAVMVTFPLGELIVPCGATVE